MEISQLLLAYITWLNFYINAPLINNMGYINILDEEVNIK